MVRVTEEQEIVVYTGYGRITGRIPIWVQGILTTLVQVFEYVDLYANLWKTKFMSCTPGLIYDHLIKYSYKWWATVEGANFWEQKRMRVSCNKCIRTMAESSPRNDMEKIHGRSVANKWYLNTGGGGRETYVVSFPQVLTSVALLVEG